MDRGQGLDMRREQGMEQERHATLAVPIARHQRWTGETPDHTRPAPVHLAHRSAAHQLLKRSQPVQFIPAQIIVKDLADTLSLSPIEIIKGSD